MSHRSKTRGPKAGRISKALTALFCALVLLAGSSAHFSGAHSSDVQAKAKSDAAKASDFRLAASVDTKKPSNVCWLRA